MVLKLPNRRPLCCILHQKCSPYLSTASGCYNKCLKLIQQMMRRVGKNAALWISQTSARRIIFKVKKISYIIFHLMNASQQTLHYHKKSLVLARGLLIAQAWRQIQNSRRNFYYFIYFKNKYWKFRDAARFRYSWIWNFQNIIRALAFSPSLNPAYLCMTLFYRKSCVGWPLGVPESLLPQLRNSREKSQFSHFPLAEKFWGGFW